MTRIWLGLTNHREWRTIRNPNPGPFAAGGTIRGIRFFGTIQSRRNPPFVRLVGAGSRSASSLSAISFTPIYREQRLPQANLHQPSSGCCIAATFAKSWIFPTLQFCNHVVLATDEGVSRHECTCFTETRLGQGFRQRARQDRRNGISTLHVRELHPHLHRRGALHSA